MKQVHTLELVSNGWLVNGKYIISFNGVICYNYYYLGYRNDYPEWLFKLRDELLGKQMSFPMWKLFSGFTSRARDGGCWPDQLHLADELPQNLLLTYIQLCYIIKARKEKRYERKKIEKPY